MFGRNPENKMVRCECGATIRQSAKATHWIVEHLNKRYAAVRVSSVLDKKAS